MAHTKGNWEHGPGLYLTTHYDTAYKYAKGGGRVYKVKVEQGTTAGEAPLDMDAVGRFVKRCVIGRKQPEVLKALKYNSDRNSGKLPAEILLNIIINHEAIQNSKSGVFKEFLTSQGVDYIIVKHYGGRDETVMVVINPKKIKSVMAVDPNTKEFELPFVFK